MNVLHGGSDLRNELTAMERLFGIVNPGGALFLVNPLGFAGHDEAQRRGVTVSSTQVRSNGAQLGEAGCLLDDGTIRVVIDSRFALAEPSRQLP